ncbi:MAG: hemerythrin domain-containing protein [Candidatus Binataceae bacterium]
MASEHARLDHLLGEASERAGIAVIESYQQFREGLLRHISIEEKILLPAAQRCGGGAPLPLAGRLRLDHGALATLMMLPPSGSTFRAVRAVLDAHNPLEESPGGAYERCEGLIGPELDDLLVRCEIAPQVPVSPWVDSSKVVAAAQRVLLRAGYGSILLNDRQNLLR